MRFLKTIAAVAAIAALGACARVPNGFVGIRVDMFGGDRGVNMQVLEPGRYFVTWNQEMYRFPTFVQNYSWEGNRQIPFQTREGLKVSAGIGISYFVPKDRARDVFMKYRRGVEEVTDQYLYNMIRDSLVRRASVLEIESVYGEGKTALLASVFEDVRVLAGKDGIEVTNLFWIGDLGLPPTVVESINNKIKATQKAAQRNNEVKEAEAEARKAVAAANGRADAMLAVAKAEAESIEIKGRAIASNPSIIQLSAIEKWDGKLPQVSTGDDKGAIPFINLK